MIQIKPVLVDGSPILSVSFTNLEERVMYRIAYFNTRKAAYACVKKNALIGERIEDFTREGVPTFIWKGKML